jgi:hypothetical protein
MYAFMYFQITPLTEWLVTHITDIWMLTSMYAFVSSDHPSDCMICYTHHRHMGVHQYVCVHVFSDNTSDQMICYIHHRHMDAHQYVCVYVFSDYAPD